MKQQGKQEKDTNTRKTLDSLCSTTSLLLSVLCCIALIHVELRIHEHHRLTSHSVTCCDQMETEILRKVQQNFGQSNRIPVCHRVSVIFEKTFFSRNSCFQTSHKEERESGNWWLLANTSFNLRSVFTLPRFYLHFRFVPCCFGFPCCIHFLDLNQSL